MELRKAIENHPALVVLGILVAGFVAGVSTYGTILQIAQLKTVPTHSVIATEQQLCEIDHHQGSCATGW